MHKRQTFGPAVKWSSRKARCTMSRAMTACQAPLLATNKRRSLVAAYSARLKLNS